MLIYSTSAHDVENGKIIKNVSLISVKWCRLCPIVDRHKVAQSATWRQLTLGHIEHPLIEVGADRGPPDTSLPHQFGLRLCPFFHQVLLCVSTILKRIKYNIFIALFSQSALWCCTLPMCRIIEIYTFRKNTIYL